MVWAKPRNKRRESSPLDVDNALRPCRCPEICRTGPASRDCSSFDGGTSGVQFTKVLAATLGERGRPFFRSQALAMQAKWREKLVVGLRGGSAPRVGHHREPMRWEGERGANSLTRSSVRGSDVFAGTSEIPEGRGQSHGEGQERNESGGLADSCMVAILPYPLGGNHGFALSDGKQQAGAWPAISCTAVAAADAPSTGPACWGRV